MCTFQVPIRSFDYANSNLLTVKDILLHRCPSPGRSPRRLTPLVLFTSFKLILFACVIHSTLWACTKVRYPVLFSRVCHWSCLSSRWFAVTMTCELHSPILYVKLVSDGDLKPLAFSCCCCCCCLPTPLTLVSGVSPIFLLVVHQPASPFICPAVPSLQRGLSANPGVTMCCVCGCSLRDDVCCVCECYKRGIVVMDVIFRL